MSGRYGIVSRLKRKKIHEVLRSGKRMDGRALDEYRDITLKTGVMEKAVGSAEVEIGKSRVLIGISVDIGRPFGDTPGKGVLICNAEFTPIAHPTFEPGPPREDSIELARVVDRGIRSAEILDFEKLCLIEGSKVYMVFVDIYVLSYDGNLFDAAALAAMAALMTTERPVHKVKDGEIELTEKTQALKLKKHPISVTLTKIGENVIADPTADEEDVMDARITVTFDEEGNICTIQKGGADGFTIEELKNSIELATAKEAELRKYLEENG
ncbi:MAG: exosome complex protein Rrp42 [Candidatus Bathyarchaeota archaeon]|jgi:exosome complex component RRP42